MNDYNLNWLKDNFGLGIKITHNLEFADDHVRHEFYALTDIRVLEIVGLVIAYQRFMLNMDGVLFRVTHVCRDWEKQDELYGDNPDPDIRNGYRNNPFASVHMYRPSRAVDGIIAIQNDKAKRSALIRYVERALPYGDENHKSVVVHNTGYGLHAHCQCIQGEHNTLVSGRSKYHV